MMLYLLIYFYKRLLTQPTAIVGLMLIVGFAVFGLTNITFTHGAFNTYFIGVISLVFMQAVSSDVKTTYRE